MSTHEDFLNEVYGNTNWQDTINNLSRKQWWNQSRKTIAKYLTKHHLPKDPRPIPNNVYTNDEDKSKKENPSHHQINAEGQNEPWREESGSYRIITDSLALQQILSGETVYHGRHLHSTFQNIDEILRSWYLKGWQPAIHGGNPIEWRNREFNHGADQQCNTVMDKGNSHYKMSRNFTLNNNITRIWTNKNNFFLQTDGGCRNRGYSSTGWRLRSIGASNTAYTVSVGGTLFESNPSSLEIEAHALLEALQYTDNLMQTARLLQPPKAQPKTPIDNNTQPTLPKQQTQQRTPPDTTHYDGRASSSNAK